MAELHPTPLTSPQTPESLSGTVAGRFRISDRLGKGGMGEVYRAEDIKLKRTVALKRLAPELRNDATYRRRFLEEAERASRFSDAHVAALYDVLEDRNEIFLVMEYVEGETLRQRLRRPMSLEEFFAIATQCAEALASAHDRGIVHCDIKPENIMLTSAGQVKILDFGVAKHLPSSDQSSTVDRAGTMAGTPAYMSPEVLMERMPDGRADVFSLGVVFYEALTGHHPFLASSFVATTDRIRKETPAPIRIFNRKAPEGLEALVNKALAKDPAQRYASARELLDDLCLVQAGLTPTKLQPLLPSQRRRRNRVYATIVAAVVAVAVFAVYRNAQGTPIVAERGWVLIADFDSRGEDPMSDTAVREGLSIALQQSRYVNVFPRNRVFDVLQRMKRDGVSRIDENLGREICQRENLQVLLTGSIEHLGPVFQITVRALDPVHGTLLFAEKERFDRKEEFFAKADAVAKRARKDMGESMAGIEASSRPLAKVTTSSLEALQLYSQAKDAMDQGKLDQALAPLQAAVQLDPDFAMAHLRLGEYYSSIVSKNEKAVAEFQRAYDLRQTVTDREQRWIEASYFLAQERYEDTARALSVLVSLYPDDPDAHSELSNAYYAVGQVDKAIAELRQVLKVNPFSASAYSRLVLYLARTNADQEALDVYHEAQRRGLDSPHLHWGLGLVYLAQGKLPEAREEFHSLESAGETYQGLGQLFLSRTDLYEGKLATAREGLESGLKREQTLRTPGFQSLRRESLGNLSLLLGNRKGARVQADGILSAPASDLQTSNLLAAGELYAGAGETSLARGVLRRLDQARNKVPTAWNKSSYLCLEAKIALAEGKGSQAASLFQQAGAEYPRNVYHLGAARAYEQQKDWGRAVQEWQESMQARGEILQEDFPPDLVLAHLQMARAYRQLKDSGQARKQYEEFLYMWQGMDDLRLKREAEKELRELSSNEGEAQN